MQAREMAAARVGRLYRGVATRWAGVDVLTLLLLAGAAEISADPVS